MIPWRAAALLGAILALCGLLWKLHDLVWDSGYQARVVEEQKASTEALRRNEINTRNLQSDVDRARKEKDDEIRKINGRLSAALERLRQRADRPPADLPGPPRACEGATGAELSGPDAGFLEREAARAEQLRAALGACYEAYDAARRRAGSVPDLTPGSERP